MKNNNHKILALKYRPKNFKELIGQDVMVQTITNSIKLKKLPNAYLLSGIRGVGKTTTARLIAKAINCNKNFVDLDLGKYCDCNSCEEIDNFKHLDVLEMDAASRTGIDDIRELIESSKYNPTSAKYKIIILDEVHMLSKQAFNGLLKTLEEPPPHLKFIFATTEIKKVPVTIISRCQRFDLNRVSISILFNNLKKIAKTEGGKISDTALKLITKAAEGSVRDSLSLLDRALVNQQVTEKEIDEASLRKMLGIADRSRILELLKFIFDGDDKNSIQVLKNIINEGVEPENFLNDLMEILYFIIQTKNLGNFDTELSISESEIETINTLSKKIETSTLIVFWQFILKGLEELSIVTNQILSLEMLVIRLIYLKDLPSYEELLNSLDKNMIDSNSEKINLNKNIEVKSISKDQIKNKTQLKPELLSPNPETVIQKRKEEKISSFEDLIKLSSKKREIELKYDLEKNVNLIKFSQGNIDISLNEKLGKNFVRNLSERLFDWTGKRWVITLSKQQGSESFSEMQLKKSSEILENEKKSEVYKKFKNVFSDGDLLEVTKEE